MVLEQNHRLPLEQPDGTDSVLLNLFLSLNKTERRERFACTRLTAELVGVSRRTIQLWIESGQIEAVRISKRYQVHLASLHDYLSQSAV